MLYVIEFGLIPAISGAALAGTISILIGFFAWRSSAILAKRRSELDQPVVQDLTANPILIPTRAGVVLGLSILPMVLGFAGVAWERFSSAEIYWWPALIGMGGAACLALWAWFLKSEENHLLARTDACVKQQQQSKFTTEQAEIQSLKMQLAKSQEELKIARTPIIPNTMGSELTADPPPEGFGSSPTAMNTSYSSAPIPQSSPVHPIGKPTPDDVDERPFD